MPAPDPRMEQEGLYTGGNGGKGGSGGQGLEWGEFVGGWMAMGLIGFGFLRIFTGGNEGNGGNGSRRMGRGR
jgi:hypothetical protein